MTAKSQPIIVIKKKGGHGGHHGGAWKVAYADFVTAMMSLFIVLWLMGSSSKVKQAVAGYFRSEGRSRWPPRWRVEGCLCGLCHRYDVTVYCAVADGLQFKGEASRGRVLQ